ncbi:separin protein [Entomophthora muscae]|uniref:Separin protein n=1 Tax=Entomophthora muscae TaxID=34485 RepID=A0ACC2UIL9_9FUNG|nr:separin protein [Entomophthora muscae]
MHENLAAKLKTPDELGPAFTALVVTFFQKVVDGHELEAMYATDGTPLRKRKLPTSKPKNKFTLAQKKVAPKVHNQAIDLVIGITKMLTKDGISKLSKDAVDCLVTVGRLSLHTLYDLEELLAPPTFSLDQMASNFSTQLISLRKFSEARAELHRTLFRIQQHLDSYGPRIKRHCGADKASSSPVNKEVESTKLNTIGFEFQLPPPSQENRSLYLLVLTLQANLLKVYAETGDCEKLEVLANSSHLVSGGPLDIMQSLMQLPGSGDFNFPDMFCHYYSHAANQMLQKESLKPLAPKLHLLSLRSLILSKASTPAGVLDVCFKIVAKLEKSSTFKDTSAFLKLYDAVFDMFAGIHSTFSKSPLVSCSALLHYLGLVTSQGASKFNAAFDKVLTTFVSLVQQPLDKEATLGRWVMAVGSVGVIFTSLKPIDEGSIIKVCDALANATNGFVKLLVGDELSMFELLGQGFKAVSRAWLHKENQQPLSNDVLSCLLESISSLLGWISRGRPQTASPKWHSLIALVCDFLLAARKPLLSHNGDAFYEQLRILGEHMLELNFDRGQQVLSSIAASCGSIVGYQANYVLATRFFAFSVKLLEGKGALELDESLRQQLASNYTNLAKVQRASGNLPMANQSLISAIKYSSSVEVGVTMTPYEVVADTKNDRLKLVESYVHWNVGKEYSPLGLSELQLDGLALAAILERELHHLQLRPSPETSDICLRLVERLIELYQPMVWHRLLHPRALLIKVDLLLVNLREAEVVLRSTVDLALNLLTHSDSLQESCQLTAKAFFLLGVVDREFDKSPAFHFAQAIQHLGKAYSEYKPPTDANPKLGSFLAEDAFQFCLRFQGLLALLADHVSRSALYQVQLAVCGARASPECIPDAIEAYIYQAQLFQDSGNNLDAEAALAQAKELAKALPTKSPAKTPLYFLWSLSHAKFLMAQDNPKSHLENERILKKLDGLFPSVKLESGRYRILSLAYQVYAHSLLIQGKIDLAIDSAIQHHRLCFKTIFGALLSRGVPRSDLSNLDNTALLGWFGRSQEHQLVADLLLCFNAFGQLYMHRGSPKDAEHMFRSGLHLAECARATSFEFKFRVRLADLQCRRHLWNESQGFSSAVLTKTMPELLQEEEDVLESRAAAIVCQGSVHLGRGEFQKALGQFEQAARLLSNSDQLPILLPSSTHRFKFWHLQAWLVCMLGWAMSKTDNLDRAEDLLKLLEKAPLPRLECQVYKLVAAKVSILSALDLAKSDSRFSSVLDSVWSLPPASNFSSTQSFKYMERPLARAARHLKEALQDATHFGFVKDLAEVCMNFGMLAFFIPRLNFQSEVLPKEGVSNWATSHLEIYKAISYRRELHGLLPAKLGIGPPADASWPKRNTDELPQDNLYWSRVFQSSKQTDPLQLMNDVLDLLPEPWAVCSLSFNPETEDLYIARFQKSLPEPVLLRLPTRRQPSDVCDTSDDLSFSLAQAALSDIIATSTKVTKQGGECDTPEKKKAWWSTRAALDSQLEELLAFIESAWLGGLKGTMAVDESTPDQVSSLEQDLTLLFKKYVPLLNTLDFKLNETILRVALKAGSMSREEIEDLMLFFLDSLDFNAPDAEVLDKLVEEAWQLWHEFLSQTQKDTCFEGSHLILILDKHTQSFPWECMPMLLGKSVSRLPSLHFLHNILVGQKLSSTSLFGNGHVVDEDKAFYVLNPDKDLMTTQKTFQDSLIKYLPWEGTIGSPPSPEQIEAALTQKDIYM